MTPISRENQVEILQKKITATQLAYNFAIEEGECFFVLRQIEDNLTKLKLVLACVIQISTWEDQDILAEVYEITATSPSQTLSLFK